MVNGVRCYSDSVVSGLTFLLFIFVVGNYHCSSSSLAASHQIPILCTQSLYNLVAFAAPLHPHSSTMSLVPLDDPTTTSHGHTDNSSLKPSQSASNNNASRLTVQQITDELATTTLTPISDSHATTGPPSPSTTAASSTSSLVASGSEPAGDYSQPLHRLQQSWTWWYDTPRENKPGERTQAAWENNVKKLMTFQTVEEFWGIYNNVVRPSALQVRSDYHLFVAGVTPAWEHEANKKGGKVSKTSYS